MNILAIGDIVGEIGCKFLRQKLNDVKKEYNIDLTVANAENSADNNGISKGSMKYVFDSGVDIITTGNHTFKNHNIYSSLDDEPYILRPANFPDGIPGKGFCIFDTVKYKVCVINLMGCAFMESLDNPFYKVDKILKVVKSEAQVTIVDFHAEATGEKGAMARYLDGRISAIFGTHTHVQTADEQILPNGTGFISDVGMTGPVHSILGVKPELIIRRMKTKLPTRFLVADGDCHMDCAIFNIDEKNGRCKGIKRLKVV